MSYLENRHLDQAQETFDAKELDTESISCIVGRGHSGRIFSPRDIY